MHGIVRNWTIGPKWDMTALMIGSKRDTMANPSKFQTGETVLIPKGTRKYIRAEKGPMLLGMELRDYREELFMAMVCDGLVTWPCVQEGRFHVKG